MISSLHKPSPVPGRGRFLAQRILGGDADIVIPMSISMTSNRPIEDWGKLLNDVPAASAILDRLLHHAEVVAITGRSHRLAASTAERAARRTEPQSGTSSPAPENK